MLASTLVDLSILMLGENQRRPIPQSHPIANLKDKRLYRLGAFNYTAKSQRSPRERDCGQMTSDTRRMKGKSIRPNLSFRIRTNRALYLLLGPSWRWSTFLFGRNVEALANGDTGSLNDNRVLGGGGWSYSGKDETNLFTNREAQDLINRTSV